MKKYIFGLVILLFITSCQTMKEIFIESIIDPKTGTQVLVRKNEFEPYYINSGELIRTRKDLKKKKLQSKLDSLSYFDSF